MWSMLTYCKLKSDQSTEADTGWHEPGWLLHAQGAWVQGWGCENRTFANHGARSRCIVRESHVRRTRDWGLTYVQSVLRTKVRLFELARNRLHVPWWRNVKGIQRWVIGAVADGMELCTSGIKNCAYYQNLGSMLNVGENMGRHYI
jgi:hypothetical protein